MSILPGILNAQTEDDVADELAEREEETELFGEEMLSHLQRLRRHPLNLNSASRSQMEALMLLTPFQIESILDRIKSSGPILSFAELGLLYGFNEKTVERLRPYIRLGEAARRPEGFWKDEKTEVYSRYQRAFSPDAEQHLIRLRSSYLDRVDLSMILKGNSTQKSSDNFTTGGISFSGLGSGTLRLDKLVIGDFYARMGQGLAIWNGYSFSGASETAGFAKNAMPISLYTSSDTSKLLRGGAFSLQMKKVRFSAGYSFKKRESVLGLNYTGRRSRYGLSYYRKENEKSVVSADLLCGLPGAIVFAEAAWSPETEQFTALGGASLEMEKVTVHFLLRKLNNQQKLSLRMAGPLYRKISYAAGVDYSRAQSSTLKWWGKLSWDDSSFGTASQNEFWIKGYVKDRLYSLKTGGKIHLFSDLKLVLRGELNSLNGRGFSSYLKLDKKRIGFTIGSAMFHVRDWAARIYFPEAELPYSFSSHLLYGQGMDFCTLLTIKPSRWLSFYLKYQYRRGVSTAKGAVRLEL